VDLKVRIATTLQRAQSNHTPRLGRQHTLTFRFILHFFMVDCGRIRLRPNAALLVGTWHGGNLKVRHQIVRRVRARCYPYCSIDADMIEVRVLCVLCVCVSEREI